MSKRIPWTDLDKKKMFALYIHGASIGTIAGRLNRSTEGIRHQLRKNHGITKDNRVSTITPEDLELAKEMAISKPWI